MHLKSKTINTRTKQFKIVNSILILFLLIITTCSSNGNRKDNSEYRVADKYGQLSVVGNFIIDQAGDTVTLEGMSLFWSQWIYKYYNYDCIKWLRDDWHCEVIRATMAIENNGYIRNPEREIRKIRRVVESCIDLGIYVIIDWHSHKAENETKEAVAFFSKIAKMYGNKPNIIYEIYNEPMVVSWTEVVKPYHEEVIAAIRAYDPDNIIIVGSPHWSQNVDEASRNPLQGKNIAYSLHFYAATHKEWLREKARITIENGLALWVTEFGTCESNGDGPIDYDELKQWFDFMEEHKISWCNWSVSDKEETSAILVPGSNEYGRWSNSELTTSGKLIRKKMLERNP
jgi:endoglucanase